MGDTMLAALALGVQPGQILKMRLTPAADARAQDS